MRTDFVAINNRLKNKVNLWLFFDVLNTDFT